MKKINNKNLSPLVSVIMNCHNGEKYLSRSIKSVLSQTYKKWELIFFDNQSNDQSKKILKKYSDKRLKYFKSKKFLNLYQARNSAISKAKGKYISFLDTDDWWISSKLSKQVKVIESKEKLNFIYSDLYIYDQKTKKSSLYFKNKMPSGKITQNLLDDYKLGILTVLMSRKIFNKKKFNKKYNIIGDFDFFLNLSLREKFYCMPEPLAYYRKHEKNYSKNIDIFTKELNNWSKKNFTKLENLNYSLKSFRYFFYKLKLKKLVGWGL